VQMDDLARTHPALYAKLMNAYRTTSIPKLTAEEKNLVAEMTAGNLIAFKAGNACVIEGTCVTSPTGPTGGGTQGAWIVVALMLALIIGVPLFCALFGNPPICRGWGF